MSAINPYISNGTCYYAAGKQADDSFIPCGNDAAGRQTCCGVDDSCLTNNACFNAQYKQTYLAGCTDPTYSDDSCPTKPNLEDFAWTGLSYCNGTSNQWVACFKVPDSTLRGDGAPCYCPQTSRNLAFSAASTLPQRASLPATTGLSIDFRPGFQPPPVTVTASRSGTTDSTSATSTTSTSRATSSSGPSPAETSPPAATAPGAPPSDNNGLSTGAKAGIGAGVAIAGLAALSALIFFFLRRRKQTSHGVGPHGANSNNNGGIFGPSAPHHGSDNHAGGHLAPGSDSKGVGFDGYRDHDGALSSIHSPSVMTGQTPLTPAVSELGSTAARPWSLRSELQGSDGIAGGWDVHRSQHEQAASSLPSPEQPQYRPYRPPGSPADPSLVPSPLIPGGGASYPSFQHHQQQHPNRQGGLSPVAELP